VGEGASAFRLRVAHPSATYRLCARPRSPSPALASHARDVRVSPVSTTVSRDAFNPTFTATVPRWGAHVDPTARWFDIDYRVSTRGRSSR